MKILELFGGVIRRGGEEMFVYNVLRRYDDPDTVFDCLVIEDCENDEFKDWVEGHGGRMVALGIPLHATRFLNHIYKPVLRYLKENRYDVIHIHSSSIAALAVLAAAAHRTGCGRMIVHSHSVGDADSFEHRLFRTLASVSMKGHVDAYCACSRAAAEWKFAPKYSAKAVIIRNGIDTELFRFDPAARAAIRRDLGIPEDAFVVGHVGRLCALKNQAFLIRLLGQPALEAANATLLLLGDGEDNERLHDLVAQRALFSRVIFTGNVTNVYDYMSAMDVFAFPSDHEGLGIVAIEAQCAGLPVVASTGVPDEIRLTDRVTFLPVDGSDDCCAAWDGALTACRALPRIDGADAVRKAGYDIRSTVGQIKEVYGVQRHTNP